MSQDVSANGELFELPRPRSAPADQPADQPAGPRRGSKGEQTRAVIVEAARRLFREHGYEATTMRAIANEAGVATGNAYYYGSKEELIGEFYARIQTEHAQACRPGLDTKTRLGPGSAASCARRSRCRPRTTGSRPSYISTRPSRPAR